MGDLAGGKLFPMGLTVEAKPCDACKMEAALLFCCTDSTYMCMDCDSNIHGNNTHERVWLCEVCEHAPSSVTCKADAAALCVRCDLDIHSANPLARRHERVPVTPFYHSATAILEAPIKPESDPNLIGYQNCKKSLCNNNSWKLSAEMKSMDLLFLDHDNLLEFDYPVPTEPVPFYGHHNTGADSVVPVQINTKPPPPPQMESGDNQIYFTTSNISSFNTAQSISQNISSDVGVVPDGSCVSDISYPFITVNSSGKVSVATDREARVMRYREKRKNRKFEKTIRYASRKAYAETRPRIKGRFAKRSENTEDVDRWFTSAPATTNFIGNSGFGVVPSF